MAKYKALFITHEMTPFLELSNISKETSFMAKLAQDSDCEVRVLMPRFGVINERRHRLHEVIRLSGSTIAVSDSEHLMIIKVASLPGMKMQVYFIDNDDYFHRKQVFIDSKKNFFPDNDERLIFFSKGAINMVKKVGWIPDIIHCHGWFSSLIPAYINHVKKEKDCIFANSKVIYSAYEDDFNENLGPKFVTKSIFDNMKKSDLKVYEGASSYDLQLGASTNSDGIIISSENIDNKLKESLSALDKPLIHYNTANNAPEDLVLFYQSFLTESLIKSV